MLDPKDVMGADYPSETFRVLQNNEMKKYGEYRTRRLVLAAYDELMAQGMRPRVEGYAPAALSRYHILVSARDH